MCTASHLMRFLDTEASIYSVHDEVKDKVFELELSWVGEGEGTASPCPKLLPRLPPFHFLFYCCDFPLVAVETGGLHQLVPKEVFEEAVQFAKVLTALILCRRVLALLH